MQLHARAIPVGFGHRRVFSAARVVRADQRRIAPRLINVGGTYVDRIALRAGSISFTEQACRDIKASDLAGHGR